MYWSALVPELQVSDLQSSLRFYLGLGFQTRFRREDPPFAYIELGPAQLMLEQGGGKGWSLEPLDPPLGRGVNFQIEVPDLSLIETGLRALGKSLWREKATHWYPTQEGTVEGQMELLVQDPDGYLLRFCQVLGAYSDESPPPV